MKICIAYKRESSLTMSLQTSISSTNSLLISKTTRYAVIFNALTLVMNELVSNAFSGPCLLCFSLERHQRDTLLLLFCQIELILYYVGKSRFETTGHFWYIKGFWNRGSPVQRESGLEGFLVQRESGIKGLLVQREFDLEAVRFRGVSGIEGSPVQRCFWYIGSPIQRCFWYIGSPIQRCFWYRGSPVQRGFTVLNYFVLSLKF